MADPKKIDTGTGGFPIDGTQYSYDVGEENEAYWNQGRQWSSGDVTVDQTSKDISTVVKKTLASYLSNTTLGKTPSSPSPVQNKYPIQHSSGTDVKNIGLSDKEGYASPLSPIDPTQPAYENSLKPGDGRSANVNLLRGREKPNDQRKSDGNTLLKDFLPSNSKSPARADGGGFNPPVSSVDSSKGQGPINDYYGSTKSVSRSMIYNRFNPDAEYGPFTAPGTNTRGGLLDADQLGSNSSRITHLNGAQFEKPRQYEFGKSPGPEKVRGVSFGVLAQVGAALSMRSSYELNSMNQGYNPTNGAAATAALAPGLTQLGLNVQRDELNAGSVIADLGPEPIDYKTILIDPASKSWGSLNNINDEFTGVSNIGMQLLAGALVVGMVVALTPLYGLFAISSGKNPETSGVKNFLGRYHLGEYYPKYQQGSSDTSSTFGFFSSLKSGNFWALLGIQKTQFPLEKCLLQGFLMSFGAGDVRASPFAAFASSLGKIVSSTGASPGYYAILARAINRSILNIVEDFAKLGKVFASIVTDPFNATNAIKQLLSVFETLKNSKFFKIANTFARLGDSWYLNDLRKTAAERSSSKLKDAATVHRLSQEGFFLPDSTTWNIHSWAAHRAPDYLLFPASAAGHDPSTVKEFGIPRMNPTVSTLKNSSIYRQGKNDRISTELREAVEDSLEAEYVPFYIHDVRTNEIVSFHAFLASLGDSYSAQYDTVDGIGRVEPVKIYKSTTRKIDFSFWIVSTNPDDFDSMWIKVNKLTTLVYPQFSKGRQVSAQGYSIYAPFSQLIQASPLVRLRIGDLIKSNYSKFNLARLFGYSYPDTTFNGVAAPGSAKSTAQYLAEQDIAKKYKTNPPVGTTWVFIEPPRSMNIETRIGDETDGLVLRDLLDSRRTENPMPRGFVLKVLTSNEEKGTVTGTIVYDEKENGSEIDAVKEVNISLWKNYVGIDLKVTVPLSTVMMSSSTEKSVQEKAAAATGNSISATRYDENAKAFMSDSPGTGNSVVRSFRSAGGKGIAGFIESMSFEWPTDKHWEIGRGLQDQTSKLGRRAPMACKVTVSFSPIHDITPGLDHTGANRAPIYPVGPLSAKPLYNPPPDPEKNPSTNNA